MTITIAIWMIPVVLTLALLLWPSDTGNGRDFGIGAAFEFLIRIIGILFVWVVYLAIELIF